MGRDSNPMRSVIIEKWEATFKHPPPAYLSVAFRTKAREYHGQCKRAGGLPAQTRRALHQIAAGKSVKDMPLSPTKAGTHYVREWNGRTYQVEVVQGGFEMDGRVWSSLSAIAKHITGTTWSGPRFFGLANVQSTAS
jgi:hypothetical protein